VGNGQQVDYQAEPGSQVSGQSAVCQSALDQRPAGPGVPRVGCSPSPGQDFANAPLRRSGPRLPSTRTTPVRSRCSSWRD